MTTKGITRLRLFFLPLFAGVALACIAGGGYAASNREHIELRLWNVPQRDVVNPLLVAQRRVFDAFRIKHPEIRVKVLAPIKIQGPAEEGNEFMAVAGGVAPDVFYLYGRKIGDYRTQGFLYPLNGYLADYARRHGKPYSGVVAPDRIWELCQDRGKIVAVPYLYSPWPLCATRACSPRRGLRVRFPGTGMSFTSLQDILP